MVDSINRAGNHDITLDDGFYAEHGQYFHNQHPQSSADCMELVRNTPGITYLMHGTAHIKLTAKAGPKTHFRVFGSPFSPAHGLWAFGYKPEEAATLWDAIPLDADIVITHTPAKGHCDTSVTNSREGCEPLRQALWRVRPKLHVCGHMHEGRGAERVTWDLSMPRIKFREAGVVVWDDPGREGKKQSLVDLTGKGGNPLQNSDARAEDSATTTRSPDHDEAGCLRCHSTAERCRCDGKAGRDASDGETVQTEARLGRRETCIVNAAYMANSWGGAKRFNKPIVVDVELPVWQEDLDGGEAGVT